MRILFYFGSPCPHNWPSCSFDSSAFHLLASHRLRGYLPALELSRRGHSVAAVISANDLTAFVSGSMERSVLIISKLSHSDERIFAEMISGALTLVAHAQQLGIDVIVDYADDVVACGDHRSRSTLELLLLADAITCASPHLVSKVSLYTSDPSRVILLPDPLEGGSSQLPREMERSGEPVRIIWFGHLANLNVLLNWLAPLQELSLTQPIALEIVSSIPGEYLLELQFGILAAGLTFPISFSEWTGPSTTIAALHRSTVAFLPVDLQGPKAGVSNNRLTEALWGGCFVVASPASSYLPFHGRGAWLGDSLVEGLRWFLDHRQEAARQVAESQSMLSDSFSLPRVADQWEQLFSRQFSGVKSQASVRINLGCGNHLLDGYLNIDIIGERAGVRPDLVCDVCDLAILPDNYASEILSVHVIEHLWRWQVENTLREWIRVLRPGGKLIVECPNLLSACEALLANPEPASAPDHRGQRTMWVLYGDPSWQDPLMCHRWAYTPNSLSDLLSEVGLISVKQEPAMFKLREPRDMRITGIKPTVSHGSRRES